MTGRRFTGVMVLSGAVIVLAAVLAIVAFRAESTRDLTLREISPCHKALSPTATVADVEGCDRFMREYDLRRPLRDVCVAQQRTLKSGWYERITRCPPVNNTP